MRGGETAADLRCVVDRLAHGQPVVQGLAQGLTLEQLRYHEGCGALRAYLENDEDVGVVEGRGGSGFTLEAREAIRVGGHVRGQDLERHLPAQALVVDAVDLAHSPGPEGCPHLEMPDAGSER